MDLLNCTSDENKEENIYLNDYNNKRSSIQFPIKCLDHILEDNKLYLLCETENKDKYVIRITIGRLWMTCCYQYGEIYEIGEINLNFSDNQINTDKFNIFDSKELYDLRHIPFTMNNPDLINGEIISRITSQFKTEKIEKNTKETTIQEYFDSQNSYNTIEYLKINIYLANGNIIVLHGKHISYSDGMYAEAVIIPV